MASKSSFQKPTSFSNCVRPVKVSAKIRCVRARVASQDRPTAQHNGTADVKKVPIMTDDYGFRSGASRLYEDQYGEVPSNVFALAIANFRQEWLSMRRTFVNDEFSEMGGSPEKGDIPRKVGMFVGGNIVKGFRRLDDTLVNADVMKSLDEFDVDQTVPGQVREQLKGLKLDAKKVEEREKVRFAANPTQAPWFVKVPYYSLCALLDLVYEGRPIQRFWVLEVVARMPYFAYISMLHLYETLGWWRAGAALRKVHFAEEWNELHHLQIMESLGGDTSWLDRFVAQHSALVYYWAIVLFYAFSPRNAYVFSELVEGHAADTYEEFIIQNEEQLKSLAPPAVAVEYYQGDDVYMFQTFMTSKESVSSPRQPKCETLYDVFVNIRDDEIEHKKTMVSCQDPQKIAHDIAVASRSQNGMCNMDG